MRQPFFIVHRIYFSSISKRSVYICNMSIEELYQIFKQYPSVNTNSKKIVQGDIFWALQGENFDGNHFVEDALANGAAYAVIDNPASQIPGKTILVKDSLQALHDLAKYHRQQLNIPVIAITGSNGKTTTKELIHAVLSSGFKTYTTEGNLNNQYGIPRTLLKIKTDAEIAIVEMGANHLGEIAAYCTYTLPTHGLITNCGKAHLEGFGSEEGVRKGKGELFDFLRRTKGTAFIMHDYDYLIDMSHHIPTVITYGTKNASIEGEIVTSAPFLKIKITKGMQPTEIQTKLVGDYNLPNILAAIAVGKYFALRDEKIKTAIQSYEPTNRRSQLVKKNGNTFILDDYNANPSSMKAAIGHFAKQDTASKILILGYMAELGTHSQKEHQLLIDFINRYNWHKVVLIGEAFKNTQHHFLYFDSSENAKEWLEKENFTNKIILLKGSRTTHLEKILEP